MCVCVCVCVCVCACCLERVLDANNVLVHFSCNVADSDHAFFVGVVVGVVMAATCLKKLVAALLNCKCSVCFQHNNFL